MKEWGGGGGIYTTGIFGAQFFIALLHNESIGTTNARRRESTFFFLRDNSETPFFHRDCKKNPEAKRGSNFKNVVRSSLLQHWVCQGREIEVAASALAVVTLSYHITSLTSYKKKKEKQQGEWLLGAMEGRKSVCVRGSIASSSLLAFISPQGGIATTNTSSQGSKQACREGGGKGQRGKETYHSLL